MTELSPAQVKFLEMRTYLNKFAVAVNYPEGDELEALRRLIADGYVKKIDRYFNLEVRQWVDVYQLTDKGLELVKQENIVAKDP